MENINNLPFVSREAAHEYSVKGAGESASGVERTRTSRSAAEAKRGSVSDAQSERSERLMLPQPQRQKLENEIVDKK